MHSASLHLPKCLGDYLLVELIQTGGQATIYRATKDNCNYALKIYHQGSKLVKSFKNEVSLLQQLQWKGITSIHEALPDTQFQGTSRNILVMPYETNGDLLQLVNKMGFLSQQACRFIAISLLTTLRYLSAHGVLHRDIKPQNVLFSESYGVLLTDFGLAGKKNAECLGDIRYAAPEIIKRMHCDERSEMFSLGVLLFFIHTGQLPFRSAKLTDPNYRHFYQGKFNLFWTKIQQKLARQLSPHFKEAITAMLLPQPDRRPTYDTLRSYTWLEPTQQQGQALSSILLKKEDGLGEFKFQAEDCETGERNDQKH